MRDTRRLHGPRRRSPAAAADASARSTAASRVAAIQRHRGVRTVGQGGGEGKARAPARTPPRCRRRAAPRPASPSASRQRVEQLEARGPPDGGNRAAGRRRRQPPAAPRRRGPDRPPARAAAASATAGPGRREARLRVTQHLGGLLAGAKRRLDVAGRGRRERTAAEIPGEALGVARQPRDLDGGIEDLGRLREPAASGPDEPGPEQNREKLLLPGRVGDGERALGVRLGLLRGGPDTSPRWPGC